MNIKIMARGIGYLLVAGGLLGAEIALSNRPYPTAVTSRTEPSPAAAALDAELAHCQAIGPEAANDAICKAVEEADRRRFVESKLYRDRVTHSFAAMPDVNEPASPLATELPTSTAPSRSMPDSSAPQPATDIAGQPQ
jgi:conjugative transfer region protein TrbK